MARWALSAALGVPEDQVAVTTVPIPGELRTTIRQLGGLGPRQARRNLYSVGNQLRKESFDAAIYKEGMTKGGQNSNEEVCRGIQAPYDRSLALVPTSLLMYIYMV